MAAVVMEGSLFPAPLSEVIESGPDSWLMGGFSPGLHSLHAFMSLCLLLSPSFMPLLCCTPSVFTTPQGYRDHSYLCGFVIPAIKLASVSSLYRSSHCVSTILSFICLTFQKAQKINSSECHIYLLCETVVNILDLFTLIFQGTCNV